MSQLIAKIIPLGIAAAISPTLLVATIFVLSSKTVPRGRAFAYWAGSTLTLAAIGVIALLGSSAVKQSANKPSVISSVIDIILGLLLFYIAYREMYKHKKPRQEKSENGSASLSRALLTSIGLGIVMTVTDFSSLVLYLSALKSTADARLGAADEIIVVAIMALFITLPIWLPLILTVVAPKRSANLLSEIQTFFKTHGAQVIAVVSVFFGVFLIYKGAIGI